MDTWKYTKTYQNGATHSFDATPGKTDAVAEMAKIDAEDVEAGLIGVWDSEPRFGNGRLLSDGPGV